MSTIDSATEIKTSNKGKERPIYKFTAIFRQLARVLFKVKVHHESILKDIELEPNYPICYVMMHYSIIDMIILNMVLKKNGLPRAYFKPTSKLNKDQGSILFFFKRGLYRSSGKKIIPPALLIDLFAKYKESKQFNMNFVPVNIFWGRNPGKEESAFKLLFFDSDKAGALQRFLTTIFQARRIQLRFGKSITLKEIERSDLSAQDCAKKMRRISRVHAQRTRNAILGPQLYSRELAAKWLMKSPLIQMAIKETAEKSGQSYEKVKASAEKMMWEISSEPTYPAIRFFEIVLPRIFNRLYQGIEIKNKEQLLTEAENSEIVYIPCHRSHLDYMLIGFFIHKGGLMTPHIAGGDNLNFFPVGMLLRRAGAFFLRRRFGGNRLYSAIFNEYVHYLVYKGHPLSFFMEGGRSRSGKMLPPKTGMLSMVVHSFLRNPKPVKLIPMSITYDKVIEQTSYKREMEGEKKRKESFGQLLNARKILKSKYGKAYLKFGDPIDLNTYFDEVKQDWRNHVNPDMSKPHWMTPLVSKLAYRCFQGIHDVTIISPVSMVATVLLSLPHRAIAESDLISVLDIMKIYLNHKKQFSKIEIPNLTSKEILAYTLEYSPIKRAVHSAGDIIHVSEEDSFAINYYRNNVVHVFLVPAMIASYFIHNDSLEKAFLLEAIENIYSFLREEYFVSTKSDDLKVQLEDCLDIFCEMGLLSHDAESNQFLRPQLQNKEFFYLNVLGKIAHQSMERFAVCAIMILEYEGKKPVSLDMVVSSSRKILERYSLLNGISITSQDVQEFARLGHFLQKNKLITLNETGDFTVTNEFMKYKPIFLRLVAPNLIDSIKRTVEKF